MTGVLLANSMAPYVAWGIGGDAMLSLPFSAVLTVLAAFIERPFVGAFGARNHPLVYSLRANIISWGIGVPIAYMLISAD